MRRCPESAGSWPRLTSIARALRQSAVGPRAKEGAGAPLRCRGALTRRDAGTSRRADRRDVTRGHPERGELGREHDEAGWMPGRARSTSSRRHGRPFRRGPAGWAWPPVPSHRSTAACGGGRRLGCRRGDEARRGDGRRRATGGGTLAVVMAGGSGVLGGRVHRRGRRVVVVVEVAFSSSSGVVVVVVVVVGVVEVAIGRVVVVEVVWSSSPLGAGCVVGVGRPLWLRRCRCVAGAGGGCRGVVRRRDSRAQGEVVAVVELRRHGDVTTASVRLGGGARFVATVPGSQLPSAAADGVATLPGEDPTRQSRGWGTSGAFPFRAE